MMRERRRQAEQAQAQAQTPTTPGAPPPAAAPAPPVARSPLDTAFGVPADATPGAEPGLEIDGKSYSRTELAKALSQAGDYTQKTQQLAARERQIQAQAEAIAQVLPHIQPELARLQQQLEGAQPPDAQLAQTDPTRYVQELAKFQQLQAEQQRVANLTALQQQAQNRAMAAAVEQANQELAQEFPFWADAAQRATVQREIVSWATTKGGYTPDELRGLTSAKMLRTMMKAAQFDKWVGSLKTAAPAQQLAAPVRGTPPPPAPSERVVAAEAAFDGKPNVRNAAALLTARRANGSA